MKLSEAMMLGSALVEMEAGNWNSCALGAAANAMGLPIQRTVQLMGEEIEINDRWESISHEWPWLEELSGGAKYAAYPDGTFRNFEEDPDWCDEIWRRFDDLVCDSLMTLEQLVDYVRCIEPECGECNRFECSCVKPSVEQPVSGVELKEKVSK